MSFTITGSTHDLGGAVRVGALITVKSRLSWLEDEHGLVIGNATTTTDSTGAIPDGFVIHAQEGSPLYIRVEGLSDLPVFNAPIDGSTLTLVEIFENNAPRPLPNTSPLVKGDKGRGVESIVNPDGDASAVVTYDDGTSEPLPLPIGPQGRGVESIVNPDGDTIATVTYDDGTSEPLLLPIGPKGDPGKDGETVTVVDNKNGTSTITIGV